MPLSKQDANQVLKLAFDDATQSLRTTSAGGSGSTTVVQPDGTKMHVTVDQSALPMSAATDAKQDTGNASLASIDSKLTSPLAVVGPITDVQLRASAVPVSNSSLPLPAGASTSAKQDSEIAALTSIQSSSTSIVTNTSNNILAINALSNKTASADVYEPYDYRAFSYVVSGNGTGQIGTITFKLGGMNGTLVATQTLSYDTQNRVVSITRS
jgi:hypothetical protein